MFLSILNNVKLSTLMEAYRTILGHTDILASTSRIQLLHLLTRILKEVDFMLELLLLLVTLVPAVETHSAEIKVKYFLYKDTKIEKEKIEEKTGFVRAPSCCIISTYL